MHTPGGRPVTAIAAGSYAEYHQELFAIVDGEVWHRWWWETSGWSDWYQQAPLGMRATDGSPLSTIAAASHSARHEEIYGLKTSGKVVHAWNWLHDDGAPDWKSESEWSDWHFMRNVSWPRPLPTWMRRRIREADDRAAPRGRGSPVHR